jgi:hypothetical protein
MGEPSLLEFAKNVPANSSLYFLHLVQLTRLTQNIFHRLYNPSAIEGTWSDVQNTIRQLAEQAETWYRNLPPMFDFRRRYIYMPADEGRLVADWVVLAPATTDAQELVEGSEAERALS